jgi:transcriptional regulator of acetoin/glycerol metabolism
MNKGQKSLPRFLPKADENINVVIRRGGACPDYRDWKGFIEKKVSSPGIDSLILNSWQRCSELGVDPTSDAQLKTISPNDDFENDLLLGLADRLDPSVKKFMISRKQIFAITNAQGHFVYRDGAPSAISKTEKLGFVVSADWSEKSVGTNAVGTALREGFPLQVFGREHFRASHHSFRCTASPFFSPSGQIMGCVDISSPLDVDHSQNFEMVIGVSRFFERILLQAHAKEMQAWPSAIMEKLRSENCGLFIVESTGIICGVEPRAQAILSNLCRNIMGRRVEELFDLGPLKLHQPTHCQLNEDKILVRTIRTPIIYAEVKPLWSPSGLWLGFLFTVLEPGQPNSSMSLSARRLNISQPSETLSFYLGNSPATNEVRRRVQAFAQTPSTVLITGETGTGKERIAKAIHTLGPRQTYPFVPINCGALPETLIQSELFGYAPGTFTGADRNGRPGLFEKADNGVIFLDEIGELPLRQQVNLLRVLEEKAVTRVGSHRPIPINLKVVAATNRLLEKEVQAGRFRDDLYHRLNVMVIHLSPLRERPDDIIPISKYHLERLVQEMGLPPLTLSTRTVEALLKRSWPGNVRSLVNALEYACNQYFIEPFQAIEPEHLPPVPAEESSPIVGSCPLASTEKQAIIQALEIHEGNISKAAKALGIGRNTFYAKMRRFEINKIKPDSLESSLAG